MNLNECIELKDTIESNLECPVCYTTNNLEKKFGCEHLVCRDCFSNQLKTSMSINLKCPICNNENLGEDVKENELNKLFALHFINCANKGIPVIFKTSNGEYINLQLGDLVPNMISEQKANRLSDRFVESLSKI